MILCNSCLNDGRQAAAVRYTFPCRRPDQVGMHQINQIFTVDVCSEHAQAFFGELADLMSRYEYVASESGDPDPEPVARAPRARPPGPDPIDAAPEPDPAEVEEWIPEAGKTYGTATDMATVRKVAQSPGKPIVVLWEDSRGVRHSSKPEQFAQRFGSVPLKTRKRP